MQAISINKIISMDLSSDSDSFYINIIYHMSTDIYDYRIRRNDNLRESKEAKNIAIRTLFKNIASQKDGLFILPEGFYFLNR